MNFGDRVEAIRAAGAKTTAEIQAEQAREIAARQQAERNRLQSSSNETWRIARAVTNQLITKSIPYDGSMYPTPRTYVSNAFSGFMDRNFGKHSPVNAIGRWDMERSIYRTYETGYGGESTSEYRLHLGGTGVIGAFSGGMTESERRRGILVCGMIIQPGQLIEQYEDINAIQNGLAFLVARHGLQV